MFIIPASLAILLLFLNVCGVHSALTVEECGKSMACWSFPRGCNDKTCDGIIRWVRKGDVVHLEWQTKELSDANRGRYSAVGFSDDRFMGDDTVFECVFSASGEGSVHISFNEGSYNVQLRDATEKMLNNSEAVAEKDLLVCKTDINLDARSTVRRRQRSQVKDLSSKRYMLQYAKGYTHDFSGYKEIHSLAAGELYPWCSTRKYRLCEDCDDKFVVITHMEQ